MESRIVKIKSVFGSILFELTKENNTIRDTVAHAIKSNVSLQGAFLPWADLRGVDLHGVNLSGVILCGADLRGADLRGAYLHGADLRDVKLSGANLAGTNLSGVNLCGADFGECGSLPSNSDIMTVGPIGARNIYVVVFHTDKGIFVSCDGFEGTLKDFEAKVKEDHKDTKHERDYMAMIAFVKVRFSA